MHQCRRAVSWLHLTWFAAAAILSIGTCLYGCSPPYPNVLYDAEGQPVQLEEVDQIISDTELSEDEKRDALRNLGVTDESLIEALIRLG
jgi:hypothetical protein